MKFQGLRDALQFRITENEDNYWDEDYCEALSKIVADDMNEAIHFIQTSCTDEEFYWLMEGIYGAVSIKPSIAFIAVLRERLLKVQKETYVQQSFQSAFMRQYVDYDTYLAHASYDIDFAEGHINLIEQEQVDKSSTVFP